MTDYHLEEKEKRKVSESSENERAFWKREKKKVLKMKVTADSKRDPVCHPYFSDPAVEFFLTEFFKKKVKLKLLVINF